MIGGMKTALAEPTIVGREHELEELMSYLSSALHGKGTTVFISGEAGSGKTKLSHEFLNRAKKHGVTMLSGWCLSNARFVYFPFFEAFSAYPGMHPAEETQAILGLFDGEIIIYEKETTEGVKRALRIRRLANQKYLEDEIIISKA